MTWNRIGGLVPGRVLILWILNMLRHFDPSFSGVWKVCLVSTPILVLIPFLALCSNVSQGAVLSIPMIDPTENPQPQPQPPTPTPPPHPHLHPHPHPQPCNLNIVRYIDSEPLLKTTPPHMLPTQSHQTECYDLPYNLVWGSAAVLQTRLQHFKANANVCVICVPDYVHMTR